ncbi:MAG: hypothetical protein AAFY34_15035 [Pseudomonadota bacterium]
MFRFLSLVLLLAGITITGFGGYQMFFPGEPEVASTPAPPPPEPIAEDAAPPAPNKTTSRSYSAAPEPNFDTVEDIAEAAGIILSETDENCLAANTADEPVSEQLRTVRVAYEVPEEATFGKPFDVTFALNGSGTGDPAATLPNQERIIENTADIGDRARASLLGSAFQIESQSPEVQIISTSLNNVWRWRVTPREAGEHALFIELYAIENGEALPVRTLNDIVTVNVSRVNQIIALANQANPIVMVLGGIGSMLAGVFGVVRFFRSG